MALCANVARDSDPGKLVVPTHRRRSLGDSVPVSMRSALTEHQRRRASSDDSPCRTDNSKEHLA
jgi:hypothetical protein